MFNFLIKNLDKKLFNEILSLVCFRSLDDIGSYGESAQFYLVLFRHLIDQPHWKYYLAIKGVLLHLGDLIAKVSLVVKQHLMNDLIAKVSLVVKPQKCVETICVVGYRGFNNWATYISV